MSPCARAPSCVLVLLAASSTAFAQTRWSQATPILPVSSTCVATYDQVGNRAIVVNVSSNTTWAVNSSTGIWSQLTPQTGGPGWITDPGFAYDAMRNRAVLFGGANANGTPIAATWELVGTSWQQPATAGSPPARLRAGMCFDAAAGVVRLAGGDAGPFSGPAQPLADVWTWNGQQWSQVPTTGSVPIGPTMMAYDTKRARCVALAANGTFEWQAGAFAAIATAHQPPPRDSTTLVYDSVRERMVLFGGRNAGATTRGDLWEYDGVDWQQRQPLGLVPRRQFHGTVYDTTLAAVRVFGGNEAVVGPFSVTNYGHADELRYEPVSPAIAQWFAVGCYFASSLQAIGLPWLGDTFALQMQLVGTGLPPLMALGFSSELFGTTPLPLPIDSLGFPNCELVVSPDVPVMPAPTGTTASISLTIPTAASLLGVRLFAQGFEPSPVGAGAATFGLLLQVGGR